MVISKEDYLGYMFLIEQRLLDNKLAHNDIKGNDEWAEEAREHFRNENKRLRDKWQALNKPEHGTPNGYIEFFNADKQRSINALLI